MPTIKKYIIKPDNVKNPFQMRATSPAKKVALTGDGTSKDYSHLLQSNMPSVTYNKPKLYTNTKTGDGLLGPIEGGGVITEIGKDANQENLDKLKAETTKKENVRTPGLTRRIDKASNPAKIERLKGKRERKQLRQDTREDLIKQRNVEKLENRTGERMQERTDRFRTRRGADVVQERQAAIGSSTKEVNLNTTARKTNELNLKSSALGIDNLQQRANVPQQTKKQRFESRAETLKHGKRKNKLINKALDVHEGYAEGDVNKYRNKLKRKNIMVTELENDSPLNVRKKFRKSSGADKSQYKIYKSERPADSIAKVGKMKSDVSKLKLDTSSKLGNTTSYKPGFGVKPASTIVTEKSIKNETRKIKNTNNTSTTPKTTTPKEVPKKPPSGKYNDSSKGNDFKPDFVVSGTNMIRLKPEGLYKQIADYTPKKIKDMSFTEKNRHINKNYNATKTIKQVNASREFSQRMKDSRDRQKIKKLRPTPLLPTSPVNYSIANPFSPNQQGVIGQVYNPSGNDISQFEQGQAFNKFASNPNTLNEPPIPTEAQTTMNDLQMENEPMGAFGDDLTGAMNNNVGLPPEQGMGSTRGFVPQLSRKERRQQRRSDRREQGTGLRNFMTRAVTGGMLGYNGPGNEDRQYRRTGTRPFGG